MKGELEAGSAAAAEGPAAAPRVRRHPEYLMPIAGQLVRDETFADARERFLLKFEYNTARAYWSDLDDIWVWASERGKDVLALTDQDVNAYVRLSRRRGYAASTIRRRQTALRGFYASFNATVGPSSTRVDGSQPTTQHQGTGSPAVTT